VPWTYEALRGEPAAGLTNAATDHNALMIVVGSRGEGLRRALARLADPSVSNSSKSSNASKGFGSSCRRC
jgi:nucleotide-binding universal stress UspA family protein